MQGDETVTEVMMGVGQQAGGPECEGEFKQVLVACCLSQVGQPYFDGIHFRRDNDSDNPQRFATEKAKAMALFVNTLVDEVHINWNEIRLLARERRGQKSGPEKV